MIICSSCGAQNMDGDKFCTSCGGKLPVTVTPEKAEEILNQVDETESIIDSTPAYEPAPVYNETPKYEAPKRDYYDVDDYNNETQKKGNGVATAGFVTSLVSFFLCCGCGFLWIVSLILSIVGLVKANKNNLKGKGIAIAGIIISAIQGICIVGYFGYCTSIVMRNPELIEEYQTYGTFSDDTIESILEQDFNLG